MKNGFFAWAVITLTVGVFCSCGGGETNTNEYPEEMQQFVEDISYYARSYCEKPDFIIIPQNGAELAFNGTDMDEGVRTSYIEAIDGIGIEELFYNGSLDVDYERLEMLDLLRTKEKIIMVADFVDDNNNLEDARYRSENKDFIAFPRSSDNYHYRLIPELISPNNNNINTLSEAQNYLYLISTENFDSKEEMISEIEKTNYDVVLIDLFFEGEELQPGDIERLKTKANEGKRLVISYISIGSLETFRYYWKQELGGRRPSWAPKRYEGYDDEYWVKFWNPKWQSIIFGNDDSYIKKIIDAGFDGAYLDNVEAYYFLEND